jgi:hypothetical protein
MIDSTSSSHEVPSIITSIVQQLLDKTKDLVLEAALVLAVMDSSVKDCSYCLPLFSPSNHNIFHVTRQNNYKQQTIQHITITMFFSLSTLLRILAASAASLPFVAAQASSETEITTDELYGNLVSTAAPAPGFNAEGGSVFTNFVDAVNNKQFFFLATGTGSNVFEKPGSEPVSGSTFGWCSDLTFSDLSNSSLMGYAARCVLMFLSGLTDIIASGGQSTYEDGQFGSTVGVSVVFVEQLNVFEGQYHRNTDDFVYRFLDDGHKTMPGIGWEGHDEGDMASNAATSSWSGFGEITFMSVEEVAQLFNTSTDEFTPDKFKQVYENTWIKEHEKEAAEKNPDPEAEQEIIEEVKNETDSAGEATSSAAPNTEVGGSGTDPATPIEDDGSAGNGRKLASVAARFVSAGLRVFGI